MASDKKSLASLEGGASLRNSYSVSVRGDSNEKKELWGARHTFAFMGFLGFSAVYSMRVNLSVAIVAMVAQNLTTNDNVNETSLACPIPDHGGDDSDVTKPGEFDWNEKTQGLILGSFYWGYASTNLLGGVAAERFGGKLVAGLGIFMTSLLTLFSPMAARTSDVAFIVLRVLEGMAEAVSFPAVNTLMAAWVLPEERSKYSALVYAGVQFGTVITLAASGFLCNSSFLGGWPSVFYVFGSAGIIWSVFWFPLVYNSPAQHPRISEQELEYLKPITYLKTSTKTRNGLLSALPYAIMYIYSLLHSLLMDMLTKNKTLTILSVRRIAMGIATFVPALALIGMCFIGCNRVWAIVILCVAVSACGASYSGHMCSHVDLAPCYAGILMGLSNTFATLPGFISPALTGVITNDNQTLRAWETVFLMSAVVCTVAGIIYIFTISADVQPWNYFNDAVEQQQLSPVVHAPAEDWPQPSAPAIVFSPLQSEHDLPKYSELNTFSASIEEQYSSPFCTTKISAAGSEETDLSLPRTSVSCAAGCEKNDSQQSRASESCADSSEKQTLPSEKPSKKD
ncbi:Major facilitator superfamily [Trinorchestia longiramus]|nr:Major facilitator superfamily [Trinorchestia longiramus]